MGVRVSESAGNSVARSFENEQMRFEFRPGKIANRGVQRNEDSVPLERQAKHRRIDDLLMAVDTREERLDELGRAMSDRPKPETRKRCKAGKDRVCLFKRMAADFGIGHEAKESGLRVTTDAPAIARRCIEPPHGLFMVDVLFLAESENNVYVEEKSGAIQDLPQGRALPSRS